MAVCRQKDRSLQASGQRVSSSSSASCCNQNSFLPHGKDKAFRCRTLELLPMFPCDLWIPLTSYAVLKICGGFDPRIRFQSFSCVKSFTGWAIVTDFM